MYIYFDTSFVQQLQLNFTKVIIVLHSILFFHIKSSRLFSPDFLHLKLSFTIFIPFNLKKKSKNEDSFKIKMKKK